MKSRSDRRALQMELAPLNASRLSAVDLADLYNFMEELEDSGSDLGPELGACRKKIFLLLAEKCKALFDTLSKEAQAEFIKELVDAKILPPDFLDASARSRCH